MKNSKKKVFYFSIPAVCIYVWSRLIKKATPQPRSLDQMFLQNYDWKFGRVSYGVIGNGPPMLLLHSLTGGASMLEWEKNIGSLKQQYRVYTLDLMGFGRSEKPNLSYSGYLYALLIKDFIQDVIGEPTKVVASLNSCFFAIMAYQLQTKNIEKLMLINPGIFNFKNKLLYRIMNIPILGDLCFFVLNSRLMHRHFLKHYVCQDNKRYDSKLLHEYSKAANFYAKEQRKSFSFLLKENWDTAMMQNLAQLSIPVTLLYGEKNNLHLAQDYSWIHREEGNISYEVIRGTRLYPHYENPKIFYQICKEFF